MTRPRFGNKAAKKLCLWALTLIYAAFLFMDWLDISSSSSDCLKYCSIILVFVLCALTVSKAANRRGAVMLIGALAFTLIADYFLLFTNRYEAGVGVFCLAHCLQAGRVRAKLLPPLALLFATCAAGCALIDMAYRLYAIAFLYALLFMMAFALIFRVKGSNLDLRMLKWGYILFLLCDINVGLYNLPVSPAISQTARGLIWLFYLPSQALIAMSGGAPLPAKQVVNRV